MYRSGLHYSGAVREFQKTFLATVLREANSNQGRAAKETGNPSQHAATSDSRTGTGHQNFALRSPSPRPRRTSCSQPENAKSGRNSFFALIALLSRESLFMLTSHSKNIGFRATGSYKLRNVVCHCGGQRRIVPPDTVLEAWYYSLPRYKKGRCCCDPQDGHPIAATHVAPQRTFGGM